MPCTRRRHGFAFVSPAGPANARAVALVLMVAILAFTGRSWAAVFYQGGKAVPLTLDTRTVTVEVDAAAAPQFRDELAKAGFAGAERVSYASTGSRTLYSVPVADLNDATLAKLAAVPGARAVRRLYSLPDMTTPLVQTDQIVLKARPDVPDGEVRAMLEREGCEIVRTMGIGVRIYVARIRDENSGDSVDKAARVNNAGGVEFAHPDCYVKKEFHAVDIDDPLTKAGWQWHLNNTGQTGGIAGADVRAFDAWEITKGEGATVAVIDSAIQIAHPDLTDAVVATFNGGRGDGGADPTPWVNDSDLYHGTACAGLACARANDVGLRGVAPMSNLIAEAIFGGTPSDAANAFYFAEQNGAQVISNSWGWGNFDVLVTAIQDVAVNGRSGKGVVVMFSSGNSGILVAQDNPYAALPEVMAIGATLKDDRLTCYSSFGPEQSVVAPGGGIGPAGTQNYCYESDMATTDIVKMDDPSAPGAFIEGYNPTFFFPPDDLEDPNYTRRFNGTSSACPVAAGCAALVFSVDSSLTAEQVRGILEHTADKVHVAGAGYDPITGHNAMYGHGRVNAYRAVQAAQAGRYWPAPVSNLKNESVGNSVYLTWTNPTSDVSNVLVLRAVGELTFAPIDGDSYEVGQTVAPNTRVVANDIITSYMDTEAPDGDLNYAVFVQNGSLAYSWGRRAVFQSAAPQNAPKASANGSPTVGPAPLTVLFSGGAVDPQNRTIVSYAWDFDDGTSGTGKSVTHTYAGAGTYIARLTVTNSVGLVGVATVPITVQAGSSSSTSDAEVNTPGTSQSTNGTSDAVGAPVPALCGWGTGMAVMLSLLTLAFVKSAGRRVTRR